MIDYDHKAAPCCVSVGFAAGCMITRHYMGYNLNEVLHMGQWVPAALVGQVGIEPTTDSGGISSALSPLSYWPLIDFWLESPYTFNTGCCRSRV